MLAAGHTEILIEMFRIVAGARPETLSVPAKLMCFGNLLPDSLPMIGVPSERSHNATLAAEMTRLSRPVGYGVLTHHYADNVTHCGKPGGCATFDKGYALKMGLIAQKKLGGKCDRMLDKIKGKSRPYVLHIISEIGSDLVVAGKDHVTETIYDAWRTAWDQPPQILSDLAKTYDIALDHLEETINKYKNMARPPREAIYSHEARAGLFLAKFEKDLAKGAKFDADDRAAVIEAITEAENVVRDKVWPFIRKTARSILDHDPNIAHFIYDIQE